MSADPVLLPSLLLHMREDLFCETLLIYCLPFVGVMGEYEPKIEVHFPESVPAAKDSAVRLECFALGK